MEERNYKMDNFKVFLIFTVVFGHFLESKLDDTIIKTLYCFIYLFHMPCFMFISGFFSKFDIKKNLKNVLWPYLVFQIYSYFFYRFFLLKDVKFSLHKPLYFLWYLLVLFIMRFTVPILDRIKKKTIFCQSLFLFITVIFALLAGFIPFNELEFSLIRFFFFYPFFVFGYLFDSFKNFISKNLFVIINVCFIIFYLFIFFSNISVINQEWLYEAYAYSFHNSHWSFSLFHLLLGFNFIFLFYKLIPNKNIKGFTFIAKNTLYIYLMHGFIVKTIAAFFKFYIKILPVSVFLIIGIILMVSIVYIFSSNIFRRFFGWIFDFPF